MPLRKGLLFTYGNPKGCWKLGRQQPERQQGEQAWRPFWIWNSNRINFLCPGASGQTWTLHLKIMS